MPECRWLNYLRFSWDERSDTVTEQEILAIYKRAGAVWFFNYNSDFRAPHVELTSGLCSDGYINSRFVLANPKIVRILARELIQRFISANIFRVDWVIGTAYSAITFSYEVARQLAAMHGFTEKDPADPKRMIWKGSIPAGSLVLQVEELITTLGTTLEVRRAVEQSNQEPVRFLPDVATAIYRPNKLGQTAIINVIALVAREVKTWNPIECPLCKAGSSPLRPKGENWTKLTGKS